MPKSRNTRKSKRQNNRIKSSKNIKSYESSTAQFHRQPESGTVVEMVAWDNELLKKYYLEYKEKYPDTPNGQYLAAFTHSLWTSAQTCAPEPKGEWVVYYFGKGFTGPCFRIAGWSGDFLPDETEFDFYVMKDWGLTMRDLYDATATCASLAEAQQQGLVQKYIVNNS